MSVATAARIRLVSSRYRELQGLLTIADAVFPLYMGAVLMAVARLDDSHMSPWVFVSLALPLLGYAIALFCWLRPRLLAYYASRFGRALGPNSVSGASLMPQGLLLSGMLADSRLPWLTTIVAVVSLAGFPAWIVWRDWPHRWHWLLPVAVALIVAGDMSLMPSYDVALHHTAGWALGVGVA